MPKADPYRTSADPYAEWQAQLNSLANTIDQQEQENRDDGRERHAAALRPLVVASDR